MSQTDSFVDEVSEELRRDRLFKLARRWGPLVLLVLIAIVGFSAWNEWRSAQDEAARQAAGDAIRTALSAADPAARVVALEALDTESFVARLPLRLALAGAYAGAGDQDAAETVLQGIIEDAAIDAIYRDMARLRLLSLRPDMPAAERLAVIEPVVRPEGAFGPLGLEQRAVARIELGDLAGARDDLVTVLADPTATQDLRFRAQALLVAIGSDPIAQPSEAVLLPTTPDDAPVDPVDPDGPQDAAPTDPAAQNAEDDSTAVAE
ncbi:MAG: tetratricopeptide repeat protein [Pseudomonadota bacterium]